MWQVSWRCPKQAVELETGNRIKKYQEPEAPTVVAGFSRAEGWGDTRANTPPVVITVVEWREAESWLRITAGR